MPDQVKKDEGQGVEGVIINRSWAMPSADTLTIKPIAELVARWQKGKIKTADPFARNCSMMMLTNDVNYKTKAAYHLLAKDFLAHPDVVGADFVLYDPPYSIRQVKEVYESVGVGFSHRDSTNTIRWTDERDIISSWQKSGDVCVSCGWSSTCMGKKRGYKIVEILLVSHGAAHNDTIVTVEQKEASLF